jgi:3-oxocholest-4-en-26-oate---CoA ligase
MAEQFTFARIIETVADLAPERTAVATSDGDGGERLSYAELDARANRCGHVLARLGVGEGDRVAVMSHNRVEWLEALVAAFKLGALVVNVNYRYTAGEVGYLLADSEPKVVLAEAEYEPVLRSAMAEMPARPHLLLIDSAPGGADPATDYTALLAEADPGRDFPAVTDGLYLLYTGGTTGLPKGVVWTQRDLLDGSIAAGWATGDAAALDLRSLASLVDSPPAAVMPLAPVMHGTGQWTALRSWTVAGTAAVWTGRSFRADKVWNAIERLQVAVAVLVGDAMAVPLVRELERHPGRWDLSALSALGSGGVVLSAGTRAALLDLIPHVTIIDGYGGSEIGTGGTFLGVDHGTSLPRFQMLDSVSVLRDDLTPAAVGETGLLAASGATASRYWRDPVKTAEVFQTDAAGKRWCLPGDSGIRNPDGTVTLLGRGGLTVNTGGEKIFAEEVENLLRGHPAVSDVLVVGAPDEVRGQQVAALVSLHPGAALTLDELQAFARRQLAGYKVPRRLVIGEIRRSPAGKPDYRWAREIVAGLTTA